MRVNGLFGHIQRNNARSLLLLTSFFFLFELLHLMSAVAPVMDRKHFQHAIASVTQTVTNQPPAPVAEPTTQREAAEQDLLDSPFMQAMRRNMWWQTLVLAVVWFAAAWFIYKYALQAATGARNADRRFEPRLFNMVETLAIQVGLPCPEVQIIESAARNAYAAGFAPASAAIVVTRGLLDALNDRELKAVLAHEIIHIRNRDIRLMAVNTIFCGMVFGAAWHMLEKGFRRGAFLLALIPPFSGFMLPFVFWTIAVVVIGSWMARFAISRAREYIADAGAVELTHDPMALASALRKLEGREVVEGADMSLQAMMFVCKAGGLFASHPSPRERIAALHFALPNMIPAEAVERVAERPEELNWANFRAAADQMPKWLIRPIVIIPVALLTAIVNFGVAHVIDPQYASAMIFARSGGWGGGFSHDYSGFKQIGGGGPASDVQASSDDTGGSFEDYFGIDQELHGKKAGAYMNQLTRARTKVAKCFPVGFAEPYESGHQPFRYKPVDDETIKNSRYADESLYLAWQYKSAMTFALNDCVANGCAGERLRFYKSALSSYMTHKMILVRAYDRNYGAAGVGFAQNYFRARQDDAIIADVRARVGRGEIDVHEFPTEYDALRMTLERAAEDFLPCHRRGEWREGLGEQLPVTEKGKRFWD